MRPFTLLRCMLLSGIAGGVFTLASIHHTNAGGIAVKSPASCPTDPTPPPLGVPLNDLAPGSYMSYQAGLYPGGVNPRPATHEAAGIVRAGQVVPRDTFGTPTPAPTGKIVMISIGFSNAKDEFGGPDTNAFKPRFDDPTFVEKNPNLVVVNGAEASVDATDWAAHDASGNPTDPAWAALDTSLSNAGLAGPQVQVAWIKEAYIFNPQRTHCCPPPPFPTHAQLLQLDIEQILRNVKKKYGNCVLAFLSTRTHAYSTTFHNPENWAFETGFADKWTIEDQINGMGNISYSSTPPVAPWTAWGPYIWANGTVPRSDGLLWDCTYLVADYVHPSSLGIKTVADQLIAFFETDPTTISWFLKPSAPGLTFNVTTVPAPATGPAPLTVQFTGSATTPYGTRRYYQWNFDDGDIVYNNKTPTKTFPAPGIYHVHATAVDSAGNSIQKDTTVTVTP